MLNHSSSVTRLVASLSLASPLFRFASAQTPAPAKQLTIEAIFADGGVTGRSPETIQVELRMAPRFPSCSAMTPASTANSFSWTSPPVRKKSSSAR